MNTSVLNLFTSRRDINLELLSPLPIIKIESTDNAFSSFSEADFTILLKFFLKNIFHK